MLITFIISQRKNIPAIRQAVESLSTTCGTCIDKENEFFAFPTPTQLAGLSLSDLQDLSLGYRAKYVYEAAQKVASGELDIKKWAMLGDDDLHKALLSCYGVGEKVANCVALFGYHRIGAFPVDVWIDRIQKTYYNGSFPVEKLRRICRCHAAIYVLLRKKNGHRSFKKMHVNSRKNRIIHIYFTQNLALSP